MPLGTEVGFGPDDSVGSAPKRGVGQQHPQISADVLWPNGWMDQDALVRS